MKTILMNVPPVHVKMEVHAQMATTHIHVYATLALVETNARQVSTVQLLFWNTPVLE